PVWAKRLMDYCMKRASCEKKVRPRKKAGRATTARPARPVYTDSSAYAGKPSGALLGATVRDVLGIGDRGRAGPLAAGVAGQDDVLAGALRVTGEVTGDAAGLTRAHRDSSAAGGAVRQADLVVREVRRSALVNDRLERGHAAADVGQTSRHLRPGDVVLVGRQRDGGQDGDDRDHDHQFDQGETSLILLHG